MEIVVVRGWENLDISVHALVFGGIHDNKL